MSSSRVLGFVEPIRWGAIKRALDTIADHDPALGDDLRAGISPAPSAATHPLAGCGG